MAITENLGVLFMDSIFGLSEKALQVCEDRSVLLSNNVVNGSTPNYKARDINFQKIMQEESANQNSSALAATDGNHLQAGAGLSGESIMYRVPMQKSLDGNTVDPELER